MKLCSINVAIYGDVEVHGRVSLHDVPIKHTNYVNS